MHQYDKFKSDNGIPDMIERLRNIPVGPIRSDESVTNMYQFVDSQTIEHCTVLTIDGVPGFAWYDPATGQRHDEGFTWPTMQIHKDATVEVLFGPDGERSAGWKKENE